MNRIAVLRKERNLNQTGLALALNVSQYTISAVETERQQPTADMLVTLSEYFGVSIDYLLCKSNIRHRAEELENDALTQKERELLDLFKELNESEKDKAMGIIFALKKLNK